MLRYKMDFCCFDSPSSTTSSIITHLFVEKMMEKKDFILIVLSRNAMIEFKRLIDEKKNHIFFLVCQNGSLSIISLMFISFRMYSNQHLQNKRSTFNIENDTFENWKRENMLDISLKYFKQVYKKLYLDRDLHLLASRNLIKKEFITRWNCIKPYINDINTIKTKDDISKILNYHDFVIRPLSNVINSSHINNNEQIMRVQI